MRILLLSMPDMVPAFRGWLPPNLAISSITGNLRGHDVYTADLILVRYKLVSSLKELLTKYNPEMIGLSAMSFQFDTARRVAAFFKNMDKSIKIVLGGYHATLMYKEISEDGNAESFDFILRGESDLSFGELVHAIEGKASYKDVMGLSFRQNGAFIHNPPRPLEDLTKIALPNRTNRVWRGYSFGAKQLDIIETSRGCTMPCNFCSMNHMYGRKFRTYAIGRVIKDIANAKQHGARYLTIADDNITLNIRRFEELCDAITEAGHNDIRYIVQTSCTGIASSDTLAEKMARAGFEFVFLGIENVSKQNLRMMRKGNILDSIKRAVELIHKNNMLIIGGMIIGNSEDKEEDIAQNYEFFDRYNIDFISDQIITPYPKTGIREELIKAGLITNLDDYRKYNGFWANVRTKYLDSEELQFTKWKYKKKYSTFFKTTPTFKSRFPFVYLLRLLLLRPYCRAKDTIRSFGKTEKEVFLEEMDCFNHLNDFKELNTHLNQAGNNMDITRN
ncbi:MAG: B12-binding domain-containing radical SAM protein [Candidatus Scalinduaceae bacterium]